MAKWLLKVLKWITVVLLIAGAWALSVLSASRRGEREGKSKELYEEAKRRIDSLRGNEAHRKELLRKGEK